MKQVIKLISLPVIAFAAPNEAQAKKIKMPKPNFVWFMTEDTSTHFMGLYNNGNGAQMPNLETLAASGVVFNNAFCNSPVSSAARTTLISGCYAPSFGGSLHRHIKLKSMPEGLEMFPAYLRDAGYFTVNASKTDYNVPLADGVWDQEKGKLGDWRNRKNPDQPFFYVRTNTKTHESSLLFDENTYETKRTKSNPANVNIHTHLPDTELVRYTYATFYDRLAESDAEFGQMVDMLREDELLDNTFVFFFGDNGGCVPGTKGYTNDNGLRVPLVVYVPEAWREVLGVKAGSHRDGLVSFMDLGPTLLKLAGLDVPKQMDGIAILGDEDVDGRESVVCYGDRFDDLYATNRVLYRDGYRYMRNYQPYQTQSQHTYYRYKSLAFQQWREMHREGLLGNAQSRFFEPFGVEALFNLKYDKDETWDLSKDERYGAVLKSMRAEMAKYMDDHNDLGLLPECILHAEALENPIEFGKKNSAQLKMYRETADLQLLPFAEAKEGIEEALDSNDDVARWWAATSAAYFGREVGTGSKIAAELRSIATNKSAPAYLRSRAALAVSKITGTPTSEGFIREAIKAGREEAEVLTVLNDFAHLYEVNLLEKVSLTDADSPFESRNISARLQYISGL